jgi:hypothetical protein
MQDAWDLRDDATPVPPGMPLLPLDKPLFRGVLFGGGGCGKTLVLMKVLRPLFLAFFGPRGCLQLASSNKAAHLVGGRTLHTAAGLRADSSLRTSALATPALEKMQRLLVPVGAVMLDEFSQTQAQLLHAMALRTTYARASAHKLVVANYNRPKDRFGRVPLLLMSGDELQLPPVPPSSGLIADLEGASPEHRAGTAIFAALLHVFRLRKMMRFSDPVLVSVYQKMRQPGGAKLTSDEWSRIWNTRVEATEDEARKPSSLVGTELWWQVQCDP